MDREKRPWLDLWTERKLGLKKGGKLTREALTEYQTGKINETIKAAVSGSEFYSRLYGNKPVDITCPEDMPELPRVSPEDLAENGQEMICVPSKEISRIVTMYTSGTTGISKRVYFTAEDQELTVDYFHHGMRNLIDEKDRLLILMPYERPGSVGDLLRAGVERLGAEVWCLGLIDDDISREKAADLMREKKITSVTGLPTQVYGLMCHARDLRPATLLLSAEYVSPLLAQELTETWGCRVFEHYGMTEMGLGCAVSCSELEGYHIREADIFIEITDSRTGMPVPEGEWGEIVFTTLTRRGMPFIRYRTGDISRFIPGPCGCGSILKRLDRVKDRMTAR